MRQIKLVLAGLLMLLAGAFYLMWAAAQAFVVMLRFTFVFLAVLAVFGMGCLVLASIFPNTALAEFLHWLMPPVLTIPLFFCFVAYLMINFRSKTPGQRLDEELQRLQDAERQRFIVNDQVAQRNGYKASAPW